jgi:formylglycine-generating enzyme required for sulfatase activity
MRLFSRLFVSLSLALGCYVSVAGADTFGSGANSFNIEFVTISSPGNPSDSVVPNAVSDPLPSGTVNYSYRMAKYEISEEIVAKVNALSDAAGDPLGLDVDIERGPQKPATGLSWFDAARFVNWLNEDQGYAPAYKFDSAGAFQLWEPTDPGFNAKNPFRNRQARYVLPSADEWHKAAYYDPLNDRYWLYPFGSDDPPVAVASGTDPGTAVYNQAGPADVYLAGGENLFGLVAMAGNVAEWEETNMTLINDTLADLRGVNGGWWTPLLPENFASSFRNSGLARARPGVVGFRIASIPEPSTILLMLVGGYTALHLGRRHSIR